VPPEAGADARPDAPVAGKLTLELDPSLDTDDGDAVKATSILSAVLLDPSSKMAATATIQFGNAVFDLRGIAAGDYFIDVNEDGEDLVPTRIDDASNDIIQRVGTKLRTGYIEPYSGAGYRFSTFSAGQNEAPVVQYSDGGVISGDQAYLLLALAMPNIEVRLLGTAELLSSYAPTELQHPSNGEEFDDWVTKTNGWCYQCHYGTGGAPAGFVSPSN
jgi:hypothetical protein